VYSRVISTDSSTIGPNSPMAPAATT
jgi:hypothetical protein